MGHWSSIRYTFLQYLEWLEMYFAKRKFAHATLPNGPKIAIACNFPSCLSDKTIALLLSALILSLCCY